MNKQKNSENSAKEELLRKIEQVSSLFSYCEKPAEGWIHTIRTALNMSTTELGKKINRTTEEILKLEEDEVQGRLTSKFKHLQNIGKVFGGRFEYVFIPEKLPLLKQEVIPKKVEKNTHLLKKTEFFLESLLPTSPYPPMPSNGWIRTRRQGLKMTCPNLQEKLNISRAHIQKMENMEKNGTLVNKMLRSAAHVLGYRIEHILIPMENLHHRGSLESTSLLKTLRQLPLLPQKPIEGWICAIRNSQGLTRAKLAERLKITERQVLLLEQSEAHNGLTYNSRNTNVNLNELAKVLGCKFDYVLIKDTPLYDETTLSKFKFIVPFPPKPRKGWISKIRNAQELSNAELAKLLNCSPNRAGALVVQETHTNPISKSAQDVIQALKCRFEYVLIPDNFEATKIHLHDVSLFEELKLLSSHFQKPKKGWIHWLRCSLKMTQIELANRIGVTPHQLSKLEWKEDHNQLINRRIMEVVKALGCHLEYRIVPNTVAQRVSTLKQDSNNALFSWCKSNL